MREDCSAVWDAGAYSNLPKYEPRSAVEEREKGRVGDLNPEAAPRIEGRPYSTQFRPLTEPVYCPLSLAVFSAFYAADLVSSVEQFFPWLILAKPL